MFKKIVKTYLWVLALPILFLPYQFLNSEVLVDKFGCGCVDGFNANTFTALFVIFVNIITVALYTIFYIKEFGLKSRKRIVIFIVGLLIILLIIGFMGSLFIYSQMWD